jgi:hypothetical protein
MTPSMAIARVDAIIATASIRVQRGPIESLSITAANRYDTLTAIDSR